MNPFIQLHQLTHNLSVQEEWFYVDGNGDVVRDRRENIPPAPLGSQSNSNNAIADGFIRIQQVAQNAIDRFREIKPRSLEELRFYLYWARLCQKLFKPFSESVGHSPDFSDHPSPSYHLLTESVIHFPDIGVDVGRVQEITTTIFRGLSTGSYITFALNGDRETQIELNLVKPVGLAPYYLTIESISNSSDFQTIRALYQIALEILLVHPQIPFLDIPFKIFHALPHSYYAAALLGIGEQSDLEEAQRRLDQGLSLAEEPRFFAPRSILQISREVLDQPVLRRTHLSPISWWDQIRKEPILDWSKIQFPRSEKDNPLMISPSIHRKLRQREINWQQRSPIFTVPLSPYWKAVQEEAATMEETIKNIFQQDRS